MPTTLSTNSAALILPDPADVTNAVASEKIPDIRGLKDMVEIPTGIFFGGKVKHCSHRRRFYDQARLV